MTDKRTEVTTTKIVEGGHLIFVHIICSKEKCPVCEWGAAICATCGGAEGSLATVCPGRKLSSEELDLIMKGREKELLVPR